MRITNIALASLLLLLLAIPSFAQRRGDLPILKAAAQGKPAAVEAILKADPTQATAADVFGTTRRARSNQAWLAVGHGSAARSVEQAVDAVSRTDGTPLQLAAASGNRALVELLLDHGADPNGGQAQDQRPRPLIAAASHGHVAAVQALLDGEPTSTRSIVRNKPRSSSRPITGIWTLSRCSSNERRISSFRAPCNFAPGASPASGPRTGGHVFDCQGSRVRSLDGKTAAHAKSAGRRAGRAAPRADRRRRDRGLQSGLCGRRPGSRERVSGNMSAVGQRNRHADPKIGPGNGGRCRPRAGGRAAAARGADATRRQSTEGGLLNLATKRRSLSVVKMLLAKTGEPNPRILGSERTPLGEAVLAGDREIVSLLLDRGADVNTLSWPEESPLYLAAERDDVAMARLLLQRKADPNARGNRKITPLHVSAPSRQPRNGGTASGPGSQCAGAGLRGRNSVASRRPGQAEEHRRPALEKGLTTDHCHLGGAGRRRAGRRPNWRKTQG